MKNKQITLVLLVMVLLASLFTVISCVPSNVEVKVSIMNKEQLTAKWTEGDAARQLQPEVTVDGKVSDKAYTVTSSAPNVVEVGSDKVTLTAKGAGKAVITLAADDATDTVEITVTPRLSGVTVTNKAAMSEVWTDWTTIRTVEVAFAPAELYTAANTTATVTCSPEGLIKAEGYKLTAMGVGTATVTVAVGEIKDTFTVEIKRQEPAITFEELPDFEVTEEDAKYLALEGATVKLSDLYSIKGSDNQITVDVEASEGLTYNSEENTVTTQNKGTYTVTVSATDKIDENLKAEKVITFDFCRKLTFWTDTRWTADELKADEEQSIVTTGDGYQMLSFNLNPSKYYYAEATYTGVAGAWLGMAHFKTETLQNEAGEDYLKENHKRVLIHAVNTWSYDYQSIDYDTLLKNGDKSGWQMLGSEWDDIAYGANYLFHHYKLNEYRNLTPSADNSVQKFAVLRMGDFFMFFMNDQYVNTVNLRFYAEGDTRPGLFVCANGNPGNIGVVRNINFFDGQEAVTEKYNALTDNGAKLIVNYVPDSWAKGSQNINNDHFTPGETTAEKGINFTSTGKNLGFNDSMIGTYQLFDGNFSFSWVYKQTDNISVGNTGDCWPRMALEVRSYKWDAERTVFGAQYGGTGGSRWLLNTPNAPEEEKWFEGQHGFDVTKPLKFTITRELTDTASKYTMTISMVDDPTVTMTRTIEVDASKDIRWDKAVILHWKTSGVNGEFSNVMWKSHSGQGNWVD